MLAVRLYQKSDEFFLKFSEICVKLHSLHLWSRHKISLFNCPLHYRCRPILKIYFLKVTFIFFILVLESCKIYEN